MKGYNWNMYHSQRRTTSSYKHSELTPNAHMLCRFLVPSLPGMYKYADKVLDIDKSNIDVEK